MNEESSYFHSEGFIGRDQSISQSAQNHEAMTQSREKNLRQIVPSVHEYWKKKFSIKTSPQKNVQAETKTPFIKLKANSKECKNKYNRHLNKKNTIGLQNVIIINSFERMNKKIEDQKVNKSKNSPKMSVQVQQTTSTFIKNKQTQKKHQNNSKCYFQQYPVHVINPHFSVQSLHEKSKKQKNIWSHSQTSLNTKKYLSSRGKTLIKRPATCSPMKNTLEKTNYRVSDQVHFEKSLKNHQIFIMERPKSNYIKKTNDFLSIGKKRKSNITLHSKKGHAQEGTIRPWVFEKQGSPPEDEF